MRHIINFHSGDNDSTILVQLRVHFNNDLEKVEQVTYAVAREVLKSQCHRDPDRDTLLHFSMLNSSGVDFAVTLSGRGLADSLLLKHEFIKRLLASMLPTVGHHDDVIGNRNFIRLSRGRLVHEEIWPASLLQLGIWRETLLGVYELYL